MAEYAVYLTQTVGRTVFIEADSPEEAEDMVLGEGSGSLCHQCSEITELDSAGWDVDRTELASLRQ